MNKIILCLPMILLMVVGCQTLPPGETYQSQAQKRFPGTTENIHTISGIAAQVAPSPFDKIFGLAEQLAILGLGVFAVAKHRRLKKVEQVLNGNLDDPQTKLPLG